MSSLQRFFHIRVSRDARGNPQLTTSPEAHALNTRKIALEGVVPMVCAVCGEAFGVVNAGAYYSERAAGVRYYCQAHRGRRRCRRQG
ncbi:MAG: hypothetical protein JXR84_04370 [Anaerolineae bacterium]|nr:hypothetical protein [Anaerolineae bacterium]